MAMRSFAALLALATLPGLAAAQACSCGAGTSLQQPSAVAALLGGKTVCATSGGERWQELHSGTTAAGGTLTDYKKGPSDLVDPSMVVGSWKVTGQGSNTRVLYDYGTGGQYSYEVCQDGPRVNFCSTTKNIIGATLSSATTSPCGPV